MATISRQQYNDLYGPTVGDKIRLGDTDLYVEITKDLCVYGDEVVYGGGKTLQGDRVWRILRLQKGVRGFSHY